MAATSAVAADVVYKKAPPQPVQLPAVDGLNGKFDAFGGSANHHGYYAGTGSLSVPVGQQFGVQFDGLAGSYRNAFLGALATHAFWRNPSQGLFGLYGSYAHLDRLGGVDVGKFGTEGAIYVGRATLEGIVGVEFGNSRTATTGNVTETIDIKTRFFDRISLGYYLTDNLKLAIGHRYTGGKSALTLGGEWGFAVPGTIHMGSAFVESRLASGDASVWAGLRMYVGQKSKSLIRRHREDDPVNVLGDEASTFGNSSSSSPATTGGGGGCPPGFGPAPGGGCQGL